MYICTLRCICHLSEQQMYLYRQATHAISILESCLCVAVIFLCNLAAFCRRLRNNVMLEHMSKYLFFRKLQSQLHAPINQSCFVLRFVFMNIKNKIGLFKQAD